MKFANNNKAIINKLTIKSVKANRLRNLFAVIAIALTTVLFTSLFTIGMGMIESMQQQTMRQSGGYAHATFKDLTKEEFDNIKNHPLIKELGYSMMVSMAQNKEFLKHHTEVRYATDTQAKMWFSYPTEGRMPEKEDEAATDTAVLDLLGIPHEIGSKITIEYYIDEKKLSKEFTLSGFWNSDEVSPSSMVFLSREFVDKNLKNINIEKMNKNQCETGLIYADVMFKNSLDIEKNVEKVLKDSGYSSDPKASDFIAAGINWAYMSTNFKLDIPTVIAILGAILLIIFTGYLIIYNIFQISVMKDIRFYGLLKTIGTTPNQIMKLIKKQAIFLSVIGIPIGLIMGYLMGNILLPIIMSTSTIKTTYISFNPIIFIGASVFSVITVFISCRKPGKIASKVSPIEATRYVDAAANYNKKEKKTTNGGKVHNMAFHNILRNKRKTITVIISMSLSLMLLNSVFTFTNGFDMDKFLSHFMITDFTAGNANYFNLNTFKSEDDVISEQMIDSISNLKGMQDAGRIYYNLKHSSTTIDNKETHIQLYGLEAFPLSQMNVFEGTIDPEKLKTGKYIIEGVPSDDNGKILYERDKYKIGDKVAITFEDNVIKEYEIIAKAEIRYSLDVKYSFLGSLTMYLPAEEFINQIKKPLTMSYIFNVDDQYIKQTEQFLQYYTNNIEPQMDYESKQSFMGEFSNFRNMFLLVGIILSFIIGAIGILNFINSMLTSIISRQREFTMLQSIGMTNKQLNSMLIYEGFFYALATIISSLLFGSLLSLIVVKPIGSSLWFFSYKFVILPILIASPILVIISVFVPLIAHISINRQSIVERLRQAE